MARVVVAAALDQDAPPLVLEREAVLAEAGDRI